MKKLKRELRLIPFDIKREMRFLDLLFSERNIVRTQAEQEVLRDMIEQARTTVRFHQSRLNRFQDFYDRLKRKKCFDQTLLSPNEVESLRKWPPMTGGGKDCIPIDDLRTGTDG